MSFRSTPWSALFREDPAAAKRRILNAFLATDGNAVRASALLDVSHRSLCRYVRALDLSADVDRIRRATRR